jgi:hypothetical protein
MSKHRDVERVEGMMGEYLEDLKNIVNIDSGTFTRQGWIGLGPIWRDVSGRLGFLRGLRGRRSMGTTWSQHIWVWRQMDHM